METLNNLPSLVINGSFLMKAKSLGMTLTLNTKLRRKEHVKQERGT